MTGKREDQDTGPQAPQVGHDDAPELESLDDLLIVEMPEPKITTPPEPVAGDQFPAEPVPRGRVSAQMMVLVVLATLALTVVLDADGLLRTAERQELGWQRSAALAVMKPIDRVAHSLYLDRPRIWLADATNHHQSTHIRSTSGIRLARESTVPNASGSVAPGATATTTTTTTLPPYRTPTNANPLRVLVAGDSLTDGVALALSTLLDGLPATVDLDRQVGTGLARPDVIDWPGELTKKMDADKPDVVVLMFGGNDAQALRTPDGWIHMEDNDAWRDEYERRVAQMMNIAARPGVSVYWIGMPVTNVASIQAKVPVIDGAIKAEAAVRQPNVTYVDPGPALDGPGGSYAQSLPDEDGHQVVVRHDDGVHMTVDGANRVIKLFILSLINNRHLKAPPPPPPASTTTLRSMSTVRAARNNP